MPKIPFQTAEGSIPASAGGVYAPMNTPVEDSIFRAGQQGQQVAHEMARDIVADRRWEEHLRNAERSVKASVAENEIRSGRDRLLEGYKDDRNYGQWFDENGQISASVRSNIDALRSQYVDSITDPVLRRAVSPHFDRAAYDVERALRVRKAQIISEDGQGQWEVMKATAIQDYINAPTALEKQAVFDTLQMKGLTYETQGILKPKSVERDMRMFLGKAEEAYIREVGNQDSIRAFNELSDKTRLTNLDPVTRETLRAAFEVKARNQQVDNAATEVARVFGLGLPGGDYESAIWAVRNPETDLASVKALTYEQRKKVEDIFRGQQAHDIATANRIEKENRDKELDAIGELHAKGDISGAIARAQRSQYIGGMDRAKIIDSLKRPQPEDRSDPATYLSGAEKMYDPSTPLEDKKKWLLTNRGRLTDGDFKHLTGIGMSQERGNDKAAIKNGIDTLKAALLTPGMVSATQKERLDRATKLYESGVSQYKDTLNTPDKIAAYAGMILKMPEFSSIDPVADMKADVSRLRNSGATPTPSVAKKTVMIDGKEYQDGDVITKDGKQFRVKVK